MFDRDVVFVGDAVSDGDVVFVVNAVSDGDEVFVGNAVFVGSAVGGGALVAEILQVKLGGLLARDAFNPIDM